MKKNRLLKSFCVLSVFALSLFAASCKSNLDNENEEKTAYLSVSVADAARTILPTFDVEQMQFTLYGVLTEENGLKGDKRVLGTFVDYKSLETDVISLETGAWDFELEGQIYGEVEVPEDFDYGHIGGTYYNSSDLVNGKARFIGSSFGGTASKTIAKGENSITFELSLTKDYYSSSDYDMYRDYYYDKSSNYHDGISFASVNSGTIDVTLNLPANSKVYVKANLCPVLQNDTAYFADSSTYAQYSNSAVKGETLKVENSSVTFKKEGVYYGYYDLSFDIYDDQEYQVKINTYKELVRVVSGCTSSAVRAIDSLNSTFYDIDYEIGEGAWVKGYVAPGCYTPNQVTKLPNATQLTRDDGYVLEGFYDNDLYAGKTYTEITGLEEDLTLYAKWVKGFVFTNDTISDFNIKAQTTPFTLIYVGEMDYDSKLRAKLEESEVYVDLIITDCTELRSLSCSYLRSVKLCEGITSIPYGCFSWCSNLQTVYLPASVKRIENYAFKYCSGLTNLYINDLSSYLNIDCGDNYSALPFSDNSNEHKLYVNYKEVKELVIPSDISVIKNGMFKYCTNITSVTIPSTVTEIEDGAFYCLSALKELNIADLNKYLKFTSTPLQGKYESDVTIKVNGSEIVDLTIPSTAKKIPKFAFTGCKNIKTVTISSSVLSIGYRAFAYCENLEEIYIPSSVLKMGSNVFYDTFKDNSKIYKVYIDNLDDFLNIQSDNNNSGVAIGYACLYLKNSGTPLNEEFTITTEQTTIPFNKSVVKTLKFAEGVTAIDTYAFDNMLSLEKIEFSSTVASIGYCAFNNCDSLVEVVIPSTVTSVSSYAFEYCDKLKEVTILNTDTSGSYSIDSWAFYGCSNLETVWMSDPTNYSYSYFYTVDGYAEVKNISEKPAN